MNMITGNVFLMVSHLLLKSPASKVSISL